MTQSAEPGMNLSQAKPQCPVHGDRCPFGEEVLKLRQEVQALHTMMHVDELTGLYNYRHFLQAMDMEMERCRRTGHPVSLVMMDVDDFKRFNDRWGHEVGNLALIHVARIIGSSLRRLDIPCRYGGEEFAIILPDTNLHAAIKLAERLRVSLVESPLQVENQSVVVTASFGVDCLASPEQIDLRAFVMRADSWLYQAKDAGRNCVRHAPDREETHVSKDERDLLLGDL